MKSHHNKFTLYFKTREKAIKARGQNSNYINDYPQDLYFYDHSSKKEYPLISYDWFPRKAKKFYKSVSMNPIMIKKELPGYLSDRLQEALWREALHIVNEGYASTKDLDRAIEDGPGMRWSLMGTFLTFHLAGGNAGMKHMLEQFGPALKLPWTKLKAPKLSKKLSNRVISGTKKQARGKSVAEIAKIRDEYLLHLQKMRKKYENKIRK